MVLVSWNKAPPYLCYGFFVVVNINISAALLTPSLKHIANHESGNKTSSPSDEGLRQVWGSEEARECTIISPPKFMTAGPSHIVRPRTPLPALWQYVGCCLDLRIHDGDSLEEWKAVTEDYSDAEHFKVNIILGWDKMNDYYTKLDETPAYYSSTILNPVAHPISSIRCNRTYDI